MPKSKNKPSNIQELRFNSVPLNIPHKLSSIHYVTDPLQVDVISLPTDKSLTWVSPQFRLRKNTIVLQNSNWRRDKFSCKSSEKTVFKKSCRRNLQLVDQNETSKNAEQENRKPETLHNSGDVPSLMKNAKHSSSLVEKECLENVQMKYDADSEYIANINLELSDHLSANLAIQAPNRKEKLSRAKSLFNQINNFDDKLSEDKNVSIVDEWAMNRFSLQKYDNKGNNSEAAYLLENNNMEISNLPFYQTNLTAISNAHSNSTPANKQKTDIFTGLLLKTPVRCTDKKHTILVYDTPFNEYHLSAHQRRIKHGEI